MISVTARIFSVGETFFQASRSARLITSRLVNRVSVLSTSILWAGLRTLRDGQRAELPSLAQYHISRIKAFIETHITDPELSIPKIAARLALSEAHLHRLFKSQAETLAQYVWSRRLEACKRALAEPALRRSPSV